MSFNESKMFIVAAGLLLAAPAWAQTTAPASPSGKSDTMPSGDMKKSDSMKTDGMKSGGMKSGGMKGSGAGPSSQGSSTPAGPAGDTEKKM